MSGSDAVVKVQTFSINSLQEINSNMFTKYLDF